MPPIPSSSTTTTTTQNLAAHLTSLSEDNKATVQLIHRLAKLDFQPASQTLHGAGEEEEDGGVVRLELSAEIHESLKSIEEELERVRQEVEDITSQSGAGLGWRRDSVKEREKSRLSVLLARLTEDLKSSRSLYRRAQLTAKHNADRAKLKERELLFSGLQSGSSSPASLRQRKQKQSLSEGEIVAEASADVTSALRRTHQLMQEELSRSRFAQETLEQSTAALADLEEKYSDLNTLLANSRALVSTLVKSTKSDTWYLETTFYILITTLIWLVFRRWLYGPLSWFVFWPLKLIFRILFAIVPIGSASSSVVTKSSSSSSSASSFSSFSPTTSLVVKPSASGAIPTWNSNSNPQQHYIRVGGGGRGYMPADDPSPLRAYSQQVGQMAEESDYQQQQQQENNEEMLDHPQLRQQNQPQGDDEIVTRSDGTVLPKSDRPRNPKKKMWEENVEREKYEQAQAKQQDGQAQRAAKDEL